MRVHGQAYRTIFVADDGITVAVIDQTRLPFAFELQHLRTAEQAAAAIRDMVVRGAPLIGVTAAYGVALGMRADPSDAGLERLVRLLGATRPTAVNLRWALARMRSVLADRSPAERCAACVRGGGPHRRRGRGRLRRHRSARARDPRAAAVAAGRSSRSACSRTATPAGSPAWTGAPRSRRCTRHTQPACRCTCTWTRRGRATRARALTAFELGAHGVPHTVIADNTGGHLMQHGEVDVCIVGSDRTTAAGDVAQQDRHLPEGACGARQRRAVLRGTAVLDDRLDDRRRRARHPDRGAPGARDDARARPVRRRTAARGAGRGTRQRGGESGFRCHAGAARHWHHHRARRGAGEPRRATVAVSRAFAEAECRRANRNCASKSSRSPRRSTRPGWCRTSRAMSRAALPGGFLITPAGVPYRDLTPDQIVEVALAAAPPSGGPRPSSEWRMHAAIYAGRPDAAAVVHTHSPQATALACAGRGIPPFHYMIALAGGDVRCMPYATFGSAELAQLRRARTRRPARVAARQPRRDRDRRHAAGGALGRVSRSRTSPGNTWRCSRPGSNRGCSTTPSCAESSTSSPTTGD